MESSNPGLSHIPSQSARSSRSPRGASAPAFGANPIVGTSGNGRLVAFPVAKNARRLVAEERYFGLAAEVLRAGARRSLAHLSRLPPDQAWFDIDRLERDFQLDAATSSSVIDALVAGGLLHPEGSARYRPTELFREYALADVVAPLPRARARGLIDRACRLAVRINSDRDRNPFQIATVLVSGSYMSCRQHLPELSLSLVLAQRPESRTLRSRSLLGNDDAVREILAEVHALSSFIVVRIVTDRNAVQRPFGVVFQDNESAMDSSVAGWDRFRDWSVSISRRLTSR